MVYGGITKEELAALLASLEATVESKAEELRLLRDVETSVRVYFDRGTPYQRARGNILASFRALDEHRKKEDRQEEAP